MVIVWKKFSPFYVVRVSFFTKPTGVLQHHFNRMEGGGEVLWFSLLNLASLPFSFLSAEKGTAALEPLADWRLSFPKINQTSVWEQARRWWCWYQEASCVGLDLVNLKFPYQNSFNKNSYDFLLPPPPNSSKLRGVGLLWLSKGDCLKTVSFATEVGLDRTQGSQSSDGICLTETHPSFLLSLTMLYRVRVALKGKKNPQ